VTVGYALGRSYEEAGAARAEVERRQEKQTSKAIADAAERDEMLTKIARGSAPAIVKISAIKELNKCTGRHSIKHLHEGKLTLAQAVAASRKPRP